MTGYIKVFFLVFILFLTSSNTVSSNENNLKLEKVPENFSKIKDSQEFKKILESIEKREPLKQNKGVDWKEFFQNARPFIILSRSLNPVGIPVKLKASSPFSKKTSCLFSSSLM